MDLQNAIIDDLIQDEIIRFKDEGYFTFASGIKSPIYTDLRRTISYPKLRANITAALVETIKKNFPKVTVIAGVATAGIPQAALVAAAMDLPMVYVRTKPKDHGTNQQIEGLIKPEDEVVLIDDLISTGGSVLKAAQAVQAAGFKVAGVVSIFSYGFPDAEKNFADAKIPFYPVLTYAQVLDQSQKSGALSPEKYTAFQNWHQDPWNWPAEN
ncbi:orotate phosphoribosyltransferase [Eupransor demetentiae]|uniref:Orotate phosphoribosyltransferase n=1 Tax=Eupransor demetentiae TaxID=3109584 RepID=A0ABP0EQK2_9LACO|nr:Orotate phosphoribosyltransferase (PyrE) [Lactobacillaceae bacterium LMG 33000]